MEEWKKELWKEIVAEEKEKARKPGEITKYDFAEMCGISVDKAKVALRKLYRQGKVTKRTIWLEETKASTALYLPVKDKV